jgi:SAM-dependent methyltransferase
MRHDNRTQDAEFDSYARNYGAGMEDPIKRAFGASFDMFLDIKVKWLLDYLKANSPITAESINNISLLDFGCGTGDFIRLLQKNAFKGQVSGCDVSKRMIEEAKRRSTVDMSSLFVVNEELDEIRPCSIDICVACCVFHHIPPEKRKRVYSKLSTALKPGGVLFVF